MLDENVFGLFSQNYTDFDSLTRMNPGLAPNSDETQFDKRGTKRQSVENINGLRLLVGVKYM